MFRRDWRINPQEQSLEPPDDDEESDEDIRDEEDALSRREDEEVESFMDGRQMKGTVIDSVKENPNVVVFEPTRWECFKAWLKKQCLAEYPDESSSVGRGQQMELSKSLKSKLRGLVEAWADEYLDGRPMIYGMCVYSALEETLIDQTEKVLKSFDNGDK